MASQSQLKKRKLNIEDERQKLNQMFRELEMTDKEKLAMKEYVRKKKVQHGLDQSEQLEVWRLLLHKKKREQQLWNPIDDDTELASTTNEIDDVECEGDDEEHEFDDDEAVEGDERESDNDEEAVEGDECGDRDDEVECDGDESKDGDKEHQGRRETEIEKQIRMQFEAIRNELKDLKQSVEWMKSEMQRQNDKRNGQKKAKIIGKLITWDSERIAIMEKLLQKYKQEGSCMSWTGVIKTGGYGSVTFQGRVWGIHRLAYLFHHRLRELPFSTYIRHLCGNNRCINPSHLTSDKARRVKHTDWTTADREQAKQYTISNSNLDALTECLLWAAGCNQFGYGTAHFLGINYSAHRLAFFASGRTLRGDQIVRHKCRNKNCCNPNHLEAGTHSQNSIDTIRDGTSRATISTDIARAIKHSKGNGTQAERAERFGVSSSIVASIDAGASWRHID